MNKSKVLQCLDLFGFLTALLLVVAWFYGLQIRTWYRARRLKRLQPAVLLIPHPLPDMRAGQEEAMALTAFGYEFDVPRRAIETHRTAATVTAYVFSGGQGITFWNPAATVTAIQTVRHAIEQSNHPFVDFLGAHTEYDLLSSELTATPEQISPFMSKQDAYRRGLLLSLKRSEMLNSPSAVYSFDLNGRRGYELGDPARDRVVEVRCFDANDREFRFLFAVDRSSNLTVDQGEIIAAIQSLRAAGTSPGELSPSAR